jgi:hypothetical protein
VLSSWPYQQILDHAVKACQGQTFAWSVIDVVKKSFTKMTPDHSHVMTMAGYPSRGADIRGNNFARMKMIPDIL